MINIKDSIDTGFNLMLGTYDYTDNGKKDLSNNMLTLSNYEKSLTYSNERIITGMYEIDRMCGEYEDTTLPDGQILRAFRTGICIKDIILIGGMSGIGKTTFAFNLFAHLHKMQIPTIFFSFDMREQRTWDGFRKALIGYHGTQIDFIEELTLHGVAPRIVTVQQIVEVRYIDMFLEKNPAKVIFIDYIAKLKPTKPCYNDKAKFAELFAELKALVEKHKCTIILLSQSKEDKGYRQGRLTLGSIYGGMEVRSEVDQVWGIYRNSVYNDKLDKKFKNITEVTGLKLRSDNVTNNICYVKFINGQMEELSETEITDYKSALNSI